jgi:hypothetical protein
MSDDFVLERLKALKEADSGLEARPEVEVRLLKSFRRRRALRVLQRSTLAAVAAAVVAGVLTIRRAPVPGAVEVERSPVVLVEPPPAPAARPVAKSVRALAKSPPKAAPPGEVATEFFSLMDTPPPFERGELLRVVVPAATMRTVGLPVGESHLSDPVQADILVGQEGLARAIRFVNHQQ